MTKAITKRITHYPTSKRYKIRKWKQKHVITGFEEGQGKRKGRVGAMTTAVLKKGGLSTIKPIRVKKKGKIITTRTPKEVIRLAKNISKDLNPYAEKIELAGSIRRKVPPKDIDMVIISKDKKGIENELKKRGQILQKGDKKIESRIEGVKVDIFFAKPKEWGAKLLFATGSGGHNIGLRQVAKKKGMKLNQYGLWKGNRLLASKTEKDIYKALDRPRFKMPEERT